MLLALAAEAEGLGQLGSDGGGVAQGEEAVGEAAHLVDLGLVLEQALSPPLSLLMFFFSISISISLLLLLLVLVRGPDDAIQQTRVVAHEHDARGMKVEAPRQPQLRGEPRLGRHLVHCAPGHHASHSLAEQGALWVDHLQSSLWEGEQKSGKS
jgi:hypothetical protein